MKKWMLSAAIVAAGNLLYALTVKLFVLPTGLVMGGTTGLGLTANYLTGVPISAFVLAFNMVMLLLGLCVLGRRFAATTLLSSFIYPLALELWQRLLGDYVLTEDVMLCTLFAGLGVGVSLGIVIRAGASTGGSDSLAMILHRTIRLPVAGVKMAADYGVMAMAFWMAGGRNLWFSVMALAIETFVMNRTMVAGAAQLQLLVISDHYEEIRQALLCEAQAGVTMLHADTGLRRTPGSVVFCVIPNKKLYGVKAAIHRIDPGAFLTIATVREVQGQGFTAARIPLPVGK